MNRQQALDRLQYAGYHKDSRMFVQTYVENRISYPVAIKEYNTGWQKRLNGVKCNCQECNPSKG